MSHKPNVVFLLADNLGYGDVGCYGCGGELRGMPTPNLDRLASEGQLLNQFMVEADQQERRAMTIENTRVIRPYSAVIAQYMATLRDHPNPPAANVTLF